MATIPHRTIESHPKSLRILCEKVLVPFIWLLFWWKTRAWVTRKESFWSISQLWNQTVTCRCFALKSRESRSWAAADVLWHVIVPGLHSSIFAPRHELNYGGLHDNMIMSHRSWLTQSVKELLCLKIKKCSLKNISNIRFKMMSDLRKHVWNEMPVRNVLVCSCI